ncbi:MAG: NAD-dependent epimerase/dehydratase family protein [Acidobacteria bacterium]|nr:MAG: NAD-dependent epimerase/dehydratase family protein [Acidobacteriota bacterium]
MRPLTDASILVTGGAGFVGSNLVRLLVDEGARDVEVIDNLLSAERWNVPQDARVRFIEGSVADDAVVGKVGDSYDYIFHLCTYHGNQSSIHDPIADHEHNQLTTLKLFERVKSFRRLRTLVYSGAGCAVAKKTFGDAEATDEEAPLSLEMDSPYSISKLVGEMYAVYYARQHRTPIVRARFQNVYGPGEILGAGRWRGTPATVWRNVTPTFIFKSLRHEALPLEAGGHATRDFVFVEDIARGLMACAVRGSAGEVYNLASGVETSIRDLAEMIDSITANPTPPLATSGRPWDRSGRRFGSTDKARRALGFATSVAIRDGLERTVAWTKTHLPQIESCMGRHRDALAAYERSHQNAPA